MKKQKILEKAILLATTAHAGQFDRGGYPYILHPLHVMSKMPEDDQELRAIAVLHDVVEDTDVTLADLVEQGFPPRVVRGVNYLTKVGGRTYEQYLEQVMKSKDAMLVKLADLSHNSQLDRLQKVTDRDMERGTKYAKAHLAITAELRLNKQCWGE